MLIAALNPTADAADVRIAEAWLAEGRPAMAVDAFQKILEAGPDPRAELGLARAQAGIGRCGEALAVFEARRGERGWGAPALYAEGACRERLGDTAAAVAAWEEAVSLDATHELSWLRLMYVAIDEDDGAAEVRAREAAWTLPSGPLLLRMGDTRRAVLRREPAADGLLFELGLYAGVAPEVRRTWAVLDGIRWLQVGACEPAAEAFQGAVQAVPSDAEAAGWRAEALRRCGDEAGAEAALSRPWLVHQDPHPLWVEVRARLAGAAGTEEIDRWAP